MLLVCDLVAGDRESAIARLERVAEHGVMGGWFFVLRHPAVDSIRGDPRFEAAMDAMEAQINQQRENLERIWAEGST